MQFIRNAYYYLTIGNENWNSVSEIDILIFGIQDRSMIQVSPLLRTGSHEKGNYYARQ